MKKLMISLFSLLILLSGCSIINNNEGLVIYTTNYAQKFIIDKIAGDYVTVYSLYNNLDENSLDNAEFTYQTYDPNTFSLLDYENKKTNLLKADIFVYNGLSNNDINIVNDIISIDKDEDVELYNIAFNTGTSADFTAVPTLSYKNQIIPKDIIDLLITQVNLSMYWITPVEVINTSKVIYEFLLDLLPNKAEELEHNYDNLVYDLNTLYAEIERINLETINNVIVSDNAELNNLIPHGIYSIYTDHQQNQLYYNDESPKAYLDNINTYVTIDEALEVNTTDPKNSNYFDLLEVLSVENYNEGLDYFQIMKKNYAVIDKVLN